MNDSDEPRFIESPGVLMAFVWYSLAAIVVLLYGKSFLWPSVTGRKWWAVFIHFLVLLVVLALFQLFRIGAMQSGNVLKVPSSKKTVTGEAFPSPVTQIVGLWLLILPVGSLLGLFLALAPPQWPPLVRSLFIVNSKMLISLNEALVTLFAAGIGSSVTTILAYLRHASVEQNFDRAYMPWYVGRPLMGMLLGAIFYFLIKGGLLATVGSDDIQATENLNDWTLAGIGGLVGLFSKNAIEKLRELFHTLFRTEDQVKDRLAEETKKAQATEKDRVQTKIRKLEKAVRMSEVAAKGLQPEESAKFGEKLESMTRDLERVRDLFQRSEVGKAAEAVAQAYRYFLENNPVRFVMERARSSFGEVLGERPAALDIVLALADGSAGLIGNHYANWRARVRHQPLAPPVVGLGDLSEEQAVSVVRAVPGAARAFAKELEKKQHGAIRTAVMRFLQDTDDEKLRAEYVNRFDSPESFNDVVVAVRRDAVTMHIQEAVEPSWFETVEGYESFLQAIDKLHEEPSAEAALDQVVGVIDVLKKEGEPISTIFAKVAKEISQ